MVERERAIERVRREDGLNQRLVALKSSLQALSQALSGREKGGLSTDEMQELYRCCVGSVEEEVRQVVASAEAWSKLPDPWASPEEHRAEYSLWVERSERLQARWQDSNEALSRPWRKQELRLQGMTQARRERLDDDYEPFAPTRRTAAALPSLAGSRR